MLATLPRTIHSHNGPTSGQFHWFAAHNQTRFWSRVRFAKMSYRARPAKTRPNVSLRGKADILFLDRESFAREVESERKMPIFGLSPAADQSRILSSQFSAAAHWFWRRRPVLRHNEKFRQRNRKR